MRVLICLIAVLAANKAEFTGPSFCEIRLIPVATGAEGTVLFKTYFKINTTGSQMLAPVELGWLVVSSSGVWDYQRETYLTFQDGLEFSSRDSAILKAFEKPFRLLRQGKSVADELRAKYDISKILPSSTGGGVLSWSPYGVYEDGKKLANATQINTIFDIKSMDGVSTTVQSKFYYKGVALFQSKKSEDADSTVQIGPAFFQPGRFNGENVWMDSYSIDGLAVIPMKD